MPGIILDTNVVSEPKQPEPDPDVTAWYGRQTTDQLFLTSTVIAELAFGIESLPAGRRRAEFEAWLRNDVMGAFERRILAFDADDAVLYGRLMAEARRRRRPARVGAAEIAAVAIRHGFAIATRNIDHFDLFDVSLINPWLDAT